MQNRVLFENVLGMRMLLLSGSEASNTCSNMHTIPFSPDMAGPQGKFCPFSSIFTPKFTLPILLDGRFLVDILGDFLWTKGETSRGDLG